MIHQFSIKILLPATNNITILYTQTVLMKSRYTKSAANLKLPNAVTMWNESLVQLRMTQDLPSSYKSGMTTVSCSAWVNFDFSIPGNLTPTRLLLLFLPQPSLLRFLAKTWLFSSSKIWLCIHIYGFLLTGISLSTIAVSGTGTLKCGPYTVKFLMTVAFLPTYPTTPFYYWTLYFTAKIQRSSRQPSA